VVSLSEEQDQWNALLSNTTPDVGSSAHKEQEAEDANVKANGGLNPSWLDAFASAARAGTSVGATIERGQRMTAQITDRQEAVSYIESGDNVRDWVELQTQYPTLDDEDYENWQKMVSTPEQAAQFRGWVDSVMSDKKTIAAAGGKGITASLAMGISSPEAVATFAIPGSGAAKFIGTGRKAWAQAVAVDAAAGSAAAAVEMQVVDSINNFYTDDEKLAGVVLGAGFGGTLGGLLNIGKLTAKVDVAGKDITVDDIAQDLVADSKKVDELIESVPRPEPVGGDAGAAVVLPTMDDANAMVAKHIQNLTAEEYANELAPPLAAKFRLDIQRVIDAVETGRIKPEDSQDIIDDVVRDHFSLMAEAKGLNSVLGAYDPRELARRALSRMSPATANRFSPLAAVRRASQMMWRQGTGNKADQLGAPKGVPMEADSFTWQKDYEVGMVQADDALWKKYQETGKDLSRQEFFLEIAKARANSAHPDPEILSLAREQYRAHQLLGEDRHVRAGTLDLEYTNHLELNATHIKQVFDTAEALDIGEGDGIIKIGGKSKDEIVSELFDSTGAVDPTKWKDLPGEIKLALEEEGFLVRRGGDMYMPRVINRAMIDSAQGGLEFKDTILRHWQRKLDDVEFQKAQYTQKVADEMEADIRAELNELKAKARDDGDLGEEAAMLREAARKQLQKFKSKNPTTKRGITAAANRKVSQMFKDGDLEDFKEWLEVFRDDASKAMPKAADDVLTSMRHLNAGLLPDNISISEIGSFKARTMDVPYDELASKNFYITTPNLVQQKWIRDTAGTTILSERGWGLNGDAGRQALIREAEQEIEALTREGKHRQAQAGLRSLKRFKANSDTFIKKLKGIDPAFDHPPGMQRSVKTLMTVNVLTDLMTPFFSALADPGVGIARGGVAPIIRSITRKMKGASKQDLDRVAGVYERITGDKALAANMFANEFQPGTGGGGLLNPKVSTGAKYDEALNVTNHLAFKANGLNFITGIGKQVFAGDFAQQVMEHAMTGKSSKTLDKLMQEGFLNKKSLRQIKAMMKKHGRKTDTGWDANMDKWIGQDGVQAARALKVAVNHVAELASPSIGMGTRPDWLERSLAGQLWSQFQGILFSLNERTLLPFLEETSNPNRVVGMGAMMTLAYLGYAARETANGREPKVTAEAFLTEGMKRSGALGVLEYPDNVLTKATAGRLGLSAGVAKVTGGEAHISNRVWASQNAILAAGGVSASTFMDIFTASRLLTSDKPITQGELGALKRLIPFQQWDKLLKGSTGASVIDPVLGIE